MNKTAIKSRAEKKSFAIKIKQKSSNEMRIKADKILENVCIWFAMIRFNLNPLVVSSDCAS